MAMGPWLSSVNSQWRPKCEPRDISQPAQPYKMQIRAKAVKEEDIVWEKSKENRENEP